MLNRFFANPPQPGQFMCLPATSQVRIPAEVLLIGHFHYSVGGGIQPVSGMAYFNLIFAFQYEKGEQPESSQNDNI